MKNIILCTHRSPHPDEILAFFLYWLYYYFLSIKGRIQKIPQFQFLFLDSGESFPENNFNNILLIGTGKGRLDEHRNLRWSDRIPGECAATLVAKDIKEKIIKADLDPKELFSPVIEEFLSYVLKHDTKGIRGSLDYADLISCSNYFLEDSEKVMNIGIKILKAVTDFTEIPNQDQRNSVAEFIENWLINKDKGIAKPIANFAKGLRNGNRVIFDTTTIFVALEQKYGFKDAKETMRQLLEAKYWDQLQFFKALEELEKKVKEKTAKITSIIRDKNLLNIVSIASDNHKMSAAARSAKGPRAAVLIQQSSDGTLIFTNKSFNLTMEIEDIVAALRLEEQLRRNPPPVLEEWSILASPAEPGKKYQAFSGINLWYFQKETRGGKIFNGTRSRKQEPTMISLGRIHEITETIVHLGQRNFKWNVWVKKVKKGLF